MRNQMASSVFSLRLLTAAICLCPTIAGAQPPDPTASDANGNTAAGTDALLNVTGPGAANTAIGKSALQNNTTGNGNTATGILALSNNTTGISNTAAGVDALFSNTTGKNNTATGISALLSNNGDNNTATGDDALEENDTGSNNTASGISALRNNTTGSFNTGSGGKALFSSTTGTQNVAVGYGALAALNSGSFNIALGAFAGKATTTGQSDIYIGHVGANENNVIRIGQAQTRTFIAGIAGVPLAGSTVVVKTNGQLGVVASSARYKQNIRPVGDASDKLAQLRPVSYRYKAEPSTTHFGLIAEEVDQVMPELVVRDDEGRPESVQYMEIIPLLLQQWKDQRHEIAEQRALIERQEIELTKLRRTVEKRLADSAVR